MTLYVLNCSLKWRLHFSPWTFSGVGGHWEYIPFMEPEPLLTCYLFLFSEEAKGFPLYQMNKWAGLDFSLLLFCMTANEAAYPGYESQAF